MKLRDAFKLMLVAACIATIFQILAVSLFAWFFDINNTIYARNLYQLPLIGVLSTLPTLIFVRSNAGQVEWIIRQILHFILTVGIVFTALIHFGWVYTQTQTIFRVFVVFLVAYLTASVIGAVRGRKLADKLNERINASHDS